jgi:excisionase family DNA binding protein
MGIMYSDLLTVGDVARQFAVTDQCVRRWIDAGLLPAFKRGRDWLIEARHADGFSLPRRGAPKKARND